MFSKAPAMAMILNETLFWQATWQTICAATRWISSSYFSFQGLDPAARNFQRWLTGLLPLQLVAPAENSRPLGEQQHGDDPEIPGLQAGDESPKQNHRRPDECHDSQPTRGLLQHREPQSYKLPEEGAAPAGENGDSISMLVAPCSWKTIALPASTSLEKIKPNDDILLPWSSFAPGHGFMFVHGNLWKRPGNVPNVPCGETSCHFSVKLAAGFVKNSFLLLNNARCQKTKKEKKMKNLYGASHEWWELLFVRKRRPRLSRRVDRFY
ncbi:uncharacterized protein LOC112350084 [Selaginella moellendorffii]|uniref:uncharacterized protein LOC112350084 n=1 Tax=Selaginella moellendorffii TaxID=88036 RepID=UPI000D1D02BD|nr:uncharacterized protein LOC112350084 [Selaginella moellendorffii]|eukprot:XP_024541464.1 uncharacterized protein LOC112350084 [Selaginella moellendorffii]